MADVEKREGPSVHSHGRGTRLDAETEDSNLYPPHHGMSVGKYCATRISTLKPVMAKAPNPIRLLRTITLRQWNFFAVAFCAWTWDAFDFFTVSLTVESLAETFDKTKTDITWGITLVLMFRSVGSIGFGIAADRYGRKWPFIVNNLLFIVLELGTGFCTNYSSFLACRALFGVAMGGLYGNAAATALEDLPAEARGLMSGLLQQGYAFGYLLAAALSRALVNTTPYGWRPLFWFGAGPPVLFILWRLALPETETFEHERRVRRAEGGGDSAGRTFVAEARVALRRHWLLLTYLVLLMAGFNFMSHGSQDLYPTLLSNQYGFSPDKVTVTQVVANLGAMLGGTVVGFGSQVVGRRLSIVVMCVAGGALLYPYSFVRSEGGVVAAAFFEQFCVQGAWGVVPAHLLELSPASFRTVVVGTSYQLGNLVSSASSTIEASLGERFPLPARGPVARYDYGLVICIFMGCVYAYVILLTLVGPEHLGRSFDLAPHDDADVVNPPKPHDPLRGASPASDDGDPEKATVGEVEKN